MRARVVTETLRGGRRQLVVTELPYAVSKARIIAQIAALSRKGTGCPEVADLRDESDREGIRLVVELKRGTDADRMIMAQALQEDGAPVHLRRDPARARRRQAAAANSPSRIFSPATGTTGSR